VVLNAISITREAENKKMPISSKIGLAKAALGPVRRIGLEHVMNCYVVWQFAENIDGAKKFLVDYVDSFGSAFTASEFYNFPSFPTAVPDIKKLLANDLRAAPSDKYAVLDDVLNWATNVGYPGYATAAIDECFNTWVLNTMFAKAATGAATPEQALSEAESGMKRIWSKWKDRGMI
jgi:multiple sugar transport system substrate-binding protein